MCLGLMCVLLTSGSPFLLSNFTVIRYKYMPGFLESLVINRWSFVSLCVIRRLFFLCLTRFSNLMNVSQQCCWELCECSCCSYLTGFLFSSSVIRTGICHLRSLMGIFRFILMKVFARSPLGLIFLRMLLDSYETFL